MITTMVGNYPKVPSLTPGGPNVRRAISMVDEGRISPDDLARIVDEATIDAINEQARAELDLLTDGQIRREDGQTYVARKLHGVTINGLIRYFDTNTYYRQPVIEDEVQWREPITVRDFQFAQRHSPKPVKAVLIGPFSLARLSANRWYDTPRDLVLALARAINHEARALQEAGAPHIQFDEPGIVKAKDQFDLFEEAAHIVTDGLTVTTHLYTWFGDVNGLAPDFFGLPFTVFGLDFVMGPANWEAIRGFPQEKALGLGIMDARNTKMETVDEVAAAVRRATEHVSPDRLYVNPSCGLEFLPRRNAFEKLVRMVEGVRRAQEVLV
ncbi:MAG: methylcobamide--CoM methyltransferase [Chloroflexi bacterium]|nr:methylcobamide--CoM methyltransferase [Chloroflexota bacterium]